MRSEEEVAAVLELVRAGWNDYEIARETGIPRGIVRDHFSHVSADIRRIFGRACDQLGIEWRPNNPWTLSVARRGSVALLDRFVGPKQ